MIRLTQPFATRSMLVVGVFTGLALVAGCSKDGAGDAGGGAGAGSDTSASAQPVASQGDAVSRGSYLVTICGCNDCHTPHKMGPQGPEPDATKMLSGHPADVPLPAPPKVDMPWLWGGDATLTGFYGPWGTSFAMNLTPDSLTGIGSWSEEIFVGAIRTGKHMGKGRPIMPPMPWMMYAKMTDDDLKAVYAYLRSIPAISNKVADYVPPSGGAPPM